MAAARRRADFNEAQAKRAKREEATASGGREKTVTVGREFKYAPEAKMAGSLRELVEMAITKVNSAPVRRFIIC